MQHILDKIDLKIITLLIERGRIKRSEIATAVGLSIPSVSERIEKIQRKGVIRKFGAFVDAKKLELDITAFIHVNLESSNFFSTFTKAIQEKGEILECYSTTGSGTFLIKAITKDTRCLELLLSEIQRWKGVKSTRTDLVLSEIKHTQPLPPSNVSSIALN